MFLTNCPQRIILIAATKNPDSRIEYPGNLARHFQMKIATGQMKLTC
jgi:hypothetical protein